MYTETPETKSFLSILDKIRSNSILNLSELAELRSHIENRIAYIEYHSDLRPFLPEFRSALAKIDSLSYRNVLDILLK
jgi:hypothetical protein